MNRLLTMLYIVLWLLLFSWTATASISKSQPNSFGTVIENDNLFTYMYGTAVSGAYIGSEKNYGLNVRFQPAHMYSLFTQEILFCGDVAKEFPQARLPVVVTYRTRTSRTIEGIGCHTLVSVDKVETKGLP